MLGFGINRIRPARAHLLCRSAGIRVFIRHPGKILVPWHRFTPLLADGRTRLEWEVKVKEDPTTVLRIAGEPEPGSAAALYEALRPMRDELEVWLPGRRRPHSIVRVRRVSHGRDTHGIFSIEITADDRRVY